MRHRVSKCGPDVRPRTILLEFGSDNCTLCSVAGAHDCYTMRWTLNQHNPELKGVKGWLLLLCVSLTILDPLTMFATLLSATEEMKVYFDQYPNVMKFLIITGVCRIALMVYSIYAGLALWKMIPGAVLTAKKYFHAVLLYSVLVVFLPRILTLPDELYRNLAGVTVLNALFTMCYITAWYLYLTHSKRVKATYTTIEKEV